MNHITVIDETARYLASRKPRIAHHPTDIPAPHQYVTHVASNRHAAPPSIVCIPQPHHPRPTSTRWSRRVHPRITHAPHQRDGAGGFTPTPPTPHINATEPVGSPPATLRRPSGGVPIQPRRSRRVRRRTSTRVIAHRTSTRVIAHRRTARHPVRVAIMKVVGRFGIDGGGGG